MRGMEGDNGGYFGVVDGGWIKVMSWVLWSRRIFTVEGYLCYLSVFLIWHKHLNTQTEV